MFMDETPEELYDCFQAAIIEECLVVDYDTTTGTIFGCIAAKPYDDEHRIHIYGILCIKRRALVNFAKWLRSSTSKNGYVLTATRRGKFIRYNTTKLLERLT